MIRTPSFVLKFHHERHASPEEIQGLSTCTNKRPRPDGITGFTICELWNRQCTILLEEGCAFTHQSDNYCKETGRKNALSDALRHFPKKIRRETWEAYFNRPRPSGSSRSGDDSGRLVGQSGGRLGFGNGQKVGAWPSVL